MQPNPKETSVPPAADHSDVSGVRTLTEPSFHLERRADQKLWVVRENSAVAVEIVRCFPWSAPERYLSLRDGDGNEQCFLADLEALDAGSRAALRASLVRSGFVLEITQVLAVEEDFELRSFKVTTRQGPRRFQTALDAWPRELEDGGLLLQDVHGDLYRLGAPRQLDRQSRALLKAFID